ncbi:MAG: hypothetical protein B0W54_06450 [Cellvibrio sp. 79]|nr:MAG: hypothetical protein B0W54_06450 [Cellvibrio sp. 79]
MKNKLIGGLIVALIFACPFFFIGGPSEVSPLFFNHLWNLGHIIFFSGVTLLALQFFTLMSLRAWLWVSVGVFCIGACIELLQHFVGRDSSWDDIFHNLCGVWFALFWGQKLGATRSIVLCLRVLSLLLVMPSFWFTVNAAYSDLQMRNQFPLINSFESDYEVKQVMGFQLHDAKKQVSDHASTGRFSLAVQFGTTKYSVVKWIGPYGDWSPYNYFAIDIYNSESQSFAVTLKIADFQHDLGRNALDDRFNRRITLAPGWNLVRVPMEEIRTAPVSRVMQMNEISCLELISISLDKPKLIYVDNVRLE